MSAPPEIVLGNGETSVRTITTTGHSETNS